LQQLFIFIDENGKAYNNVSKFKTNENIINKNNINKDYYIVNTALVFFSEQEYEKFAKKFKKALKKEKKTTKNKIFNEELKGRSF
jgi:hypothetical protein